MLTPWYIFTEICSFVTEATGNLLLFIARHKNPLPVYWKTAASRGRQKLTCMIKWQIKTRSLRVTMYSENKCQMTALANNNLNFFTHNTGINDKCAKRLLNINKLLFKVVNKFIFVWYKRWFVSLGIYHLKCIYLKYQYRLIDLFALH